MKRQGKKSRLWNATRAKLKIEFEGKGITFCEMCKSRFGLSFAHRLKRRYIQSDEELKVVALLCLRCHEQIEHTNPETMYLTVTAIIEKRNNYQIEL